MQIWAVFDFYGPLSEFCIIVNKNNVRILISLNHVYDSLYSLVSCINTSSIELIWSVYYFHHFRDFFISENVEKTQRIKWYVVRHHESHIMSEKQYFSFWQIWILQIIYFKSIYNLPITFPLPQKKEMMESLKFSFPGIYLASWAINMISDFIRVTLWRTTYISNTENFGDVI